jgi:hypothetical protein
VLESALFEYLDWGNHRRLHGAISYLLLQVVFIAALPHSAFAHGWANLSFTGKAGPFAGLATTVGLGWLATLLYIDAVISPSGTGLIYTAVASRVSYGLWLPVYLIGMGLISWQGGYCSTGPASSASCGATGHFGLWWDMLVIAAFSLAIYFWAQAVRLPQARTQEYVGSSQPASIG